MRGSLKAVLSRVDRLIDRGVVRAEDLAASLRFMSDEELERRIVQVVEKAGGTDAFIAQMGWDPEEYPEVRRLLRGNTGRT